MRKKLLIIITKSEMGGAQKFLYELVTHLDSLKYEITVAAGHAYHLPAGQAEQVGGNGSLFEILEEKNIKTIKITNFSNLLSIKNLLAFIEIFNVMRKNQPEIIYLLSSEAGFTGSLVGSFYRFFLRKKIKIIYRIGGWAFKEPKNIFIKKIYLLAEKISAPFKDIIITNSEFDCELAIKNKIAKPEKIITIYNGLDIDNLKFLPKEQSRKFLESKIENLKLKIENSTLVGTIANLYKNKGLEFLILAAKIIKGKNLDWQFIIIGDGPEKQYLEKIIKKHKLENTVYLINTIPDAYQYLKSFNLFVLPSVKEGQPWVILEAMAANVPIVATNIAGIPEMIESEVSGLLVEPADSEALAIAIEKMLTHPSLASECAKKALTVVKEKFSLAEMIRKNEGLF